MGGYEPTLPLWRYSINRQRAPYFDSALSSNLSNPIVLTSPFILPNSTSGGLVILNNSITQLDNAF